MKKNTYRLIAFRRGMINYFLRIFTLPGVRDEITRYARVFMGEASRYSAGFKGEAVETREAFAVLTKYIRKEKISRAEKKQFKNQMVDILRGTGVVVPFMLIPLPFIGTLLLIIVDHLLLAMNIQILPASFYPEKKKDLLTAKGIDEDLEKAIAKEK